MLGLTLFEFRFVYVSCFLFPRHSQRSKLGYWIVEDLVDRSTEFYPRGGLKQLVRRVFFCASVSHLSNFYF
jgi:hypothetical protein